MLEKGLNKHIYKETITKKKVIENFIKTAKKETACLFCGSTKCRGECLIKKDK